MIGIDTHHTVVWRVKDVDKFRDKVLSPLLAAHAQPIEKAAYENEYGAYPESFSYGDVIAEADSFEKLLPEDL